MPDTPEPIRLRFGQEVILECGAKWGGDKTLYVGVVERRASTSINGSFLSSESSREYVLQDPLDASFGDAAEYAEEPHDA